MTRTEYEAKKAELIEKRNAISKEIDKLSDSFHDEELKEYKEKFEGKYVLYYERELRKNGKGPIIPTKYTIYKIDEVTFVGYDFINVNGKAYRIVNDKYDCHLTIFTRDEFHRDLQMSTWQAPDKFLTKDEFEVIINELEDQFSKLCDGAKWMERNT